MLACVMVTVPANELIPRARASAMLQLDDAGLVRVGGGHSVTLEQTSRELLRKPLDRRPSRRSGKARAKARAGRSA
jgi:hypothetical protein